MTKKYNTLLDAFRATVGRKQFEVNATAKRLNVPPKKVRNCIDQILRARRTRCGPLFGQAHVQGRGVKCTPLIRAIALRAGVH